MSSLLGNLAAIGVASALKNKLGKGGLKPSKPGPITQFYDLNGTQTSLGTENRVIIKVPNDYLNNYSSGSNNELKNLGGIIFPYTPQISLDHKADYASESPTHSNFTQYFYKHSAISPISITGKFTVQNDKDAGTYLSTVHLLSALVKMRFGNDEFAGAPPPVCRLNAYGLFGINNVPVVISNFRQELPDSVDYYTTSKTAEFALFGVTSVPTISTVSITCNPVYSRQEMMDFNIPDWLQSGSSSRGKGYL